MEIVIIITAVTLLALAGVLLLWARSKIRHLKKLVKDREQRVESASKTLLEKHFELMDVNDRLNKMLQTKSDFIGVASHQLRTPLTDVRYGLHFLLDGKPNKLTAAQKTHIETILAAVERMNNLVNELLDYVRSEEGKTSHRLVQSDVDAFIGKTIDNLSQHFRSKRIALEQKLTFHLHGHPFLLIDESLLSIAVTNLVNNAFQYTPQGKSINIHSDLRDNAFYFEVKDQGVGIPQDRQELVFGKFKRGDAALEMNAPGIGLGLHITKKIIEGMGGTIGFLSDGKSGSTFYFTLPLEA